LKTDLFLQLVHGSNQYITILTPTKQQHTCQGNLRGPQHSVVAGLLARGRYVLRQAISRHRFSWFSSVFKQILRWFPSSKLLLSASHAALPDLNLSELTLLFLKAPNCFSKLCHSTTKSKFRGPYVKALHETFHLM
jgi:hypothetical protein